MDEFELIRRYFAPCASANSGTRLGIGDDAALLAVPEGAWLVATVDTLTVGTHFLAQDDPASLGHKALAVNLSDLAAMGADPAWALLALTLPQADEAWLTAFAEGFHDLAARYDVALVGGDTTRGPLSFTVQALGTVPVSVALRRDGARPGDQVCVTGTLGDAALALEYKLGHRDGAAPAGLAARLERPEPRLETGRHLRGRATACIDISDGLAADLRHILVASGVGATLDVGALPCSEGLKAAVDEQTARAIALAGGDDYELCFTLPASEDATAIEQAAGCPVTVVGEITAEPGLREIGPDGVTRPCAAAGWCHFA